MSNKCKHERLAFHSGGFYVGCLDCFVMWVAIKPETVSDADIDYTRQSPLAGTGHFKFKEGHND